jgi:replicative DNA helicase
MTEKPPVQSEGEQLDDVLEGLQASQQVKEISGWESGFPNLSRALDGIFSGLYLLVGPPSCGKTSFVKQLLDQVAMLNATPGIFFSFAERRNALRIRTLSRLSGLENREIRRGSAYLLHWYGVPKARYTEVEQVPASWEKLKRSADDARVWLDGIYLVECGRETDLPQIEEQIREVRSIKQTDRVMVVIDDCQRLGDRKHTLIDRLAMVTEQLQAAAVSLKIPILATWPHWLEDRGSLPQIWSERAPSADVILVLEMDAERTKTLIAPNQALTIHIVKNRGGEKGKLAFDFYPSFSKWVELG